MELFILLSSRQIKLKFWKSLTDFSKNEEKKDYKQSKKKWKTIKKYHQKKTNKKYD